MADTNLAADSVKEIQSTNDKNWGPPVSRAHPRESAAVLRPEILAVPHSAALCTGGSTLPVRHPKIYNFT